MVDASAYRTYVTMYFGATPIDVTAAFISWDAGGEINDGEGKLLFSGELVLGDGPTLPDICNPRKNAGYLYRRTPVVVECDRADGGGRVRHPIGLLYVVSEPNEPNPSDPEIRFELGCQLTLESEEDEVGFAVTGVKEGPELDEDGEEKPSKYEQAALDNLFYYQDRYGGIPTGSNLLNGPPSRTFYLGRDEVEYKTGGVSGEPQYDAFRLTGTGKRKLLNHTTTTTITTETGLAAMIDPNLGPSEITTRKVTAIETVTHEKRVRSETVEMAGGMAAPISYPGLTTLVTAETSVTEHVYETTGERRLKFIKSEKQALFELAMKEYFDKQFPESIKVSGVGREMVTAETSETTYEYAADNTVKATTTTVLKPLGAIVTDEGESNATGFTAQIEYQKMMPAEITRTEYTKLVDGSWKRTTTSRVPAVSVREVSLDGQGYAAKDVNLRAEIKSALVYRESTVEVSNSGQTTPPAAERGVEKYRFEEYPIKVEIGITGTTGQLKKPKIQEINVPSAKTEQDLVNIGLPKMARRKGRERSVEFQLPFDDIILQQGEVQPIWKFVYPDGSADIVLVQGLQYSHDAEQAICGATAVRLAMTQPGSDAYITPYPALEIITEQPSEDGTKADPELVIYPPPIILKQSVCGFAIGRETFYEIKPHRPVWLSEVGLAIGRESTIPLSTYKTYTTSTRGVGIGRENWTLNRKTLRSGEKGVGIGRMLAKVGRATIISERGVAIGRIGQQPISSSRGIGVGRATIPLRETVRSDRALAIGRENWFVTAIPSTKGIGIGKPATPLARQTWTYRGIAIGRMLTILPRT